MPATPEDILKYLAALGIDATTHHHAPAFTVEQGNLVWGDIPGIHCKNLFLKDAKGRLWLVVAPADRKIELKTLPALIGSARLSFGSADLLRSVLGIEPGSVTPLALINDPDHRVTIVIDAWMMAQELLNFHPLTNAMTTTLTADGFRSFLRSTGHECVVAEMGSGQSA